MKINVNLNQKIGQPNFGSFGAGVSIELEIDQAQLAKPDDVLAQIRFAGDLARAAVERELHVQRVNTTARERLAAPREPGADDEPADDVRPGDSAYDRAKPEPRRDDREPRDNRRENRYWDGGPNGDADQDRDEHRARSSSRGRSDDRRGGGGGRDDRIPRSGKQLYGWANDRDEVKWFIGFGKVRGFPPRMNDWNEDDVADAMNEYWAKRGPTSRAASNGDARRN